MTQFACGIISLECSHINRSQQIATIVLFFQKIYINVQVFNVFTYNISNILWKHVK